MVRVLVHSGTRRCGERGQERPSVPGAVTSLYPILSILVLFSVFAGKEMLLGSLLKFREQGIVMYANVNYYDNCPSGFPTVWCSYRPPSMIP